MTTQKYFAFLSCFLLSLSIVAQNESEPNDASNQATTVACNSIINGFIQTIGDVDWYAINVSENGSLRADLTGVPGNLDLTMDVFKVENGLDVFIADDTDLNASNGQSVFSAAFVEAGTYYIRIFDEGNNSSNTAESYNLEIICLGDAYEVNHTIETAAFLPINGCIETMLYGENACYFDSNFGDNDLDWFAIEVPGTGTLATALTNVPGEVDLDMAIYQLIDGQIVFIADDTDTNASNGQSVFSQAFVEAGTYYIFIQDENNNSWSFENYTLCNTFVPSPYEINQTIEQAAPIPLVGCIQETLYGENDLFNDSNFGDNDRDFFSIEVTETGVVTLELDQVPANLDLDLALLTIDENGQTKLIAQDNDSNASNGQTMRSFGFVDPGTYYIRVTDESNNALSPEPYNLCVDFLPNALEINQTFELAAAIPKDTCFQDNIFGENNCFFTSTEGDNDRDWFKFDVEQAGEISVAITSVPANLDLNTRIYRVENDQLIVIAYDSDDNASGGQSIFADAFVFPGTYYIIVNDESNNSGSIEPYNFCLSFAPNLLEVNQTFEIAAPIPPDTCFEDRIYGENNEFFTSTLGDNDIDWFVFNTPDSCELAIDLTQVASNLDLDARVFEIENGQPVAVLFDNTSNAGGGQSISVDGLLAGGEYYVRIIDENNNGRNAEYYNFCLECALLNTTNTRNRFTLSNTQLYPNPTQGVLRLDLGNLPINNATLNVYAIHGASVLQQKLSAARNQIDVSMLRSGLYWVEVITDGATYTGRIVKQ